MPSINNAIYTAHVTTTHGREGHSVSDDKKLDITLTPTNGTGTNPEQLFAAGYSACFGSAMKAIADKQKLEAGEITIDAYVSLHKEEEKGFYLSVSLTAKAENLDEAATQNLMEEAHQMCPYSKATRGNIEVTLTTTSTAHLEQPAA